MGDIGPTPRRLLTLAEDFTRNDRVWNRKIDPGKVFDMMLPLEQVAEAYRAMDERRAIKVLLQP